MSTSNAYELLKQIEDHCREKFEMSSRMKLHLASNIQRLMDEKNTLQTNISNVLNGHSTYNPKDHTLRLKKS